MRSVPVAQALEMNQDSQNVWSVVRLQPAVLCMPSTVLLNVKLIPALVDPRTVKTDVFANFHFSIT